MTDQAAAPLDVGGIEVLTDVRAAVAACDDWREQTLEDATRAVAEARDLKLGKVAQPLRAALTGTTASPGIFEVMDVLGREETLGRLDDVLARA